ncbi:MAG TPA: SRPBCC family protein [Candidatus Thermoplasmatota archaeon]|nr:SRPBCC family protein [Candidatus Thermoplasmatota archaeon]
MTRVVKETVVRAPPERVFRALTQPAERALWIASMREKGTGAPLAVGARVEGQRTAPGSRSTYLLTVRRLDAPRALEMDIARNGDPVGSAGYELAPTPEGTKVRGWAEAQLKGLQKLAAPMVTKGMEDELVVDLASLKKYVEAGGA